MTADKSNH